MLGQKIIIQPNFRYISDFKEWAIGRRYGTKYRSFTTINVPPKLCPTYSSNTWKYVKDEAWKYARNDLEVKCKRTFCYIIFLKYIIKKY